MNDNTTCNFYEELEVYEKEIKERKKEIFQKIILNAIYSLKIKQPISNCYKKINLSSFPKYSEKIIGQILGKGGNHKNEFVRITGVNLEIDKDTNNCIIISKYNSIDIEKAYMLISRLLDKNSWSPESMQKEYQIVIEEFKKKCISIGNKVLTSYLKYDTFTLRLAELVGLLKYSYSYNQNMLDHSHEVAQLCANVASQMSLDPLMAKRAGFFHDIGKSIANYEDHVKIGVEIGKSEFLEPYIINAIASHHGKTNTNNPYSVLVKCMDKVSAGRIAARPLQNEIVEKRKNLLQKSLMNIEWIKNIILKNGGNLIQIFINIKNFDHEKIKDMKKEVKEIITNNDSSYKYNYEIEFKMYYEESFNLNDIKA